MSARAHRSLKCVFVLLVSFSVSASSLLIHHSSQQATAAPTTSPGSEVEARVLSSLGGYFIENKGQVTDGDRYYVTGNPAVAFRDDGVLFVFRDSSRDRLSLDNQSAVEPMSSERMTAYMLRFDGAAEVRPIGINPLPFNSNFFIGNVPSRWKTNVPNYQGILYRNLYDGIDLAYHFESGRVKYEFILHPGADPSSIITRYEGVDDVVLQGGDLVFQTGTGEIRDSAPIAYQGADEVRCAFALREHWQVGFDCGPWDRSRELVIDPLMYSTYLGGGLTDEGWSIAVDSAGDAYVTGETRSADFPVTPGVFDATFGGESDAFVAKLNPTGSSLIYCTYLGGIYRDVGHAIAIDSAGDAYFTGDTYSPDFPVTPSAFDTTFAGISNVFVAELNPTGSSLIYSTYLGGNGGAGGWSIAVDPAGDVYVTGGASADFPVTPGAFDTTYDGGLEAFVTKLDHTGSSLIYSTYLGGGGEIREISVAIDPAGYAYVTGATNSPNFPVTPGAFDTSYSAFGGSPNAFVAKLDPTGSSLIYSTYLGGSVADEGLSIAIDSAGDAYVTGETASTDFPGTPSSFDTTINGRWDAFAAKLNAAGTALVYATFLGGVEDDVGLSITVDPSGNAYLTGETSSANFPVTPGAFDTSYNGIRDAFVAKLDPTGNSLIYSTYLGGSNPDGGFSIKVDSAGDAYLTGYTYSADFPVTPDAFDKTLNGVDDAFVVKPRLFNTPPAMTITFPSGGEVWTQGSSHTIIWTASDNEDPSSALRVWINYTSGAGDGSVCGPVAGDVGSCPWTLPTIVATDVVLNGTVIDTGDLKGYGKSGPFAIQAPQPVNTPPTVTITSPTGGEEFLKGSSHTITWTMHDDQDINANLTIYVNYTTRGVTNKIVAGLKGQESYQWELPEIEANDVTVNITVVDTGGLKGYDDSGPFTIMAPEELPQRNETNYKPIVAAVFAIILAVAGIWSSKRRPWKRRDGRDTALKAFVVFSLPFVLAEAGTGVVSFLTGQLSIPPVMGIGTAVDLAILIAGILVAALTASKERAPAGEQMGNSKSR